MTSNKRQNSSLHTAALILVAALIAFIAAACGGGGGGGDSASVSSPRFAPEGGEFHQSVLVAVYSTTDGSHVMYTTDGSTPTATHGTLAENGVIDIDETVTVKAVAVKGSTLSDVSSETYTIIPEAARPTLSVAPGLYTSTQSVTITCATDDALIRYTTDGSTPTATHGTLYTGPVEVEASTMLMAVAYLDGYDNSDVAQAIYTITGKVETPALSPAGGIFTTSQAVSISCATPGATIRYTTDGSAPTRTSGNIYGGAIAVNDTKTLKAIAYKTNWADSDVATETYTITRTVEDPVINPATGSYGGTQTVSITTPTAGASIYYTTNGDDPTTSSTPYAGTFTQSSTATIKARAFKTGWTSSAIVSSTLTITEITTAPQFSEAEGSYSDAISVTITCPAPDADAAIHYTTNGDAPTASSALYTGAIDIASTTTLKAIAIKAGKADSPVTSATYTITYVTAAPVFTPGEGTYGDSVSVTITTTTGGATIRYTTDGTAPSRTVGTIYADPVEFTSTKTLKAIAYKNDFEDSSVTTGLYTIKPKVLTPVITPSTTSHLGSVSVKITCATTGATIRYTTDGSTPTESSTIYTGPLVITESKTVKAKAFKAGSIASEEASVSYTITPVAGMVRFSPAPGRYIDPVTVTLSNTTPGATIYYTTDGTAPSSTNGAVYVGPFTLTASKLVKAVAVKTGLHQSSVAVGMYTVGTEQEGLFADANLEACVREALEIDGSTTITIEMLAAPEVTTLVCPSLGITDVNGVQNMTNLTWLDLSDNVISDASLIGGLTRLAFLDLKDNRLPSAQPLFDLENLTYLDLSGNQLDDIAPLADLTGLAYLGLARNAVSDLTPLGNMDLLTVLDLSDNLMITNANVVADLTKLQLLDLSGNSIPDLPTLKNLTALRSFNASRNILTDAAFIAENTLLTDLYLEENFLPDTEDLYKLSALKRLTLRKNLIGDVHYLREMVELRDLDLSENEIAELNPLSGMQKLENLAVNDNQITDVAPLVLLANLKNLYAQDNCIEDWAPVAFVPYVNMDSQRSDCEATLVVANPELVPGAGGYIGEVRVAIVTSTPGATIRYTLDGTDPNDVPDGPGAVGTTYEGAFVLSSSATVKAIAFREDWTTSAITSADYTVLNYVALPIAAPAEGTYPGSVAVTLTCATPGSSIRYTTDGSEPSQDYGTVYGGAINLTETTTIKFVAYKSGYAPSPVQSGTWEIIPVVATPTFDPVAGTYNGGRLVTIETETPGATIRYTLDGQTPTETTGVLYAGPVVVNGDATLKAIAFKTDYVTSAVATASYVIVPVTQTPTANPASGTSHFGSVVVTLGSVTVDATIRYTVNGAEPTTTTGTVYTGPITLTQTSTVRAIAYRNGYAASDVARFDYLITPVVAAPTFGAPSGTYVSSVSVTLATATPGALINYTLDGTLPTETYGLLYGGAINVTENTIITAVGFKAGMITSDASVAIYEITPKVATPAISPAAPGPYRSFVDVTLTIATAGAQIRYTLDGSVPTATTGVAYTAPVRLIESKTITAKAFKDGWADSDSAAASYTINAVAATPVFSPAPSRYATARNVTLTTSTSGAKIYYTNDGTTPSATNGTQYTGPIYVASSTVLKAVAVKDGLFDSNVAVGMYTIGALQNAAFADQAFEDCVREALGIGPLVGITTQMLADPAFTTLDCSNRGITDINGVQNMLSLTTLDFSGNAITDATLLGGLTSLTTLDLSGNQLASAEPVAGLTSLDHLGLNATGITDATPLAGLTSLTWLGLNGNRLTDLTPLSNLSLLATLDLGDNLTIQNVEPLGALSALAWLNLSGNAVFDAGPLAALGQLNYLDLGRNRLDDAAPLASLSLLTDLYLDDNLLEDAAPLAGLLNLKTLSLAGNDLTDLGALTLLTGLTDLNLSDNQLDDLRPLSGLMKLETLSIDQNDFTDVAPLALMVNLKVLNARYNCITDFSPLALLSGLTTYSNPQSAGCDAIARVVADPTFTPGTGDYVGSISVALWTDTSGATIRYTTNGTTPNSTTGTVYDGAFTVAATTTVKAIAYRSGWTDSAVITKTYTVIPYAAAPAFTQAEGVYDGTVTVGLSTTSGGASIRYTLDGTEPTAAYGLPYGAALTFNAPPQTVTVKAIAYGAGYATSPVESRTYTVRPIVSIPVVTPAPGAYNGSATVTIASATAGAEIRYTTDGSSPTSTTGTIYSGEFVITQSCTVKAIAYKDGYADSPIGSAAYTINPTADTPVITPASGSFVGDTEVTIATSTFGASINYTTDGTTPSDVNGTLYTGPFTLTSSATVKAIAFKAGLANSPVTSAVLTITPKISAPTVTPASGTYGGFVSVTITKSSASGSIRYTLDGTTPSSTVGTIYTDTFAISTSATLKAIEYATGWASSDVVVRDYVIQPFAATPTFTPGEGTFQGPVAVTIATTTTGATIRYTTDGTTPTATTGTIYAGPVTMAATGTLKAVAYRAGYAASPVMSGYFIVLPIAATPVFSPASGTTGAAPIAVTITSATDGATIVYTTDGTTPTATHGTVYAGPFNLNASTVVNAIAYAAGIGESRVATASFTIDNSMDAAFPDAAFEACVLAALTAADIANNPPAITTDFTMDNLALLTGTLYCTDMGISTINGVQTLTGITGLVVNHNNIDTLAFVAGLDALTMLEASDNRLTSMAPVAGLGNLTHVDLSDNFITDMNALGGLVGLTWIDVSGNLIESIEPISDLTLVTHLDVGQNLLISDLDPIAGYNVLVYLDAQYNSIADFSPINTDNIRATLTYLDLSGNYFPDVAALAGFTGLTTLYLGNNYLTDVTPLSGLVYLTELNLRSNLLVDVTALEPLTALKSLWLDENQIVDVAPLAGMQELQTLSLNNNNIAAISPLLTLVNLETLNVGYNCIPAGEILPFTIAGVTVNTTGMRASCP